MTEPPSIQVAGFGGAEDAWLSGIMGRPVYRLSTGACAAPAPRPPFFAYLKVPAADLATTNRALKAGFVLAEAAVTLEGEGVNADGAGARFATPGDADAVAAVAGSCFTLSRFHADPGVDDAIANRIKAEWTRNFFHGRRGSHMVVAGHDGQVTGFLQIIVADGVLLIDLIGVVARAQGQGLGRTMIGFAAANIAGWSRLRVGTQLCNTGSIALYQRLGLKLAGSSYSLHFHGN